MRHLWLTFARLPHPDAVSYPASEEDVRLVLDLFDLPLPKRAHLAEQLRNFLRQQERYSVFDRQNVPLRRPNGLYLLIPWRFAKWLAQALVATDSARERVRGQIGRWLSHDERETVTVVVGGSRASD